MGVTTRTNRQTSTCGEDLPIVVLGEDGGAGGYQTVSLEFAVLRKRVRLRIGYRDEPARLADIVPVARILSSKVVQTKMDMVRMVGRSIPCRKCCDACCHTPVMVSAPEAIYLVEELKAQLSIEQFERFSASCSGLNRKLERSLPEHAAPDDARDVSASELSSFSDWYANSDLCCPFLCRGSCEIYEQRPIVCRECFVMGDASQCRIGEKSAVVKTILGPVQLGNVLMRLAGEFTHVDREGILLQSVFSWYHLNEVVREQRWPAEMLVERFAEIVRSKIGTSEIREKTRRGKPHTGKTAAVR